jgi:endonuclease YncB( thermonuclease family)
MSVRRSHHSRASCGVLVALAVSVALAALVTAATGWRAAPREASAPALARVASASIRRPAFPGPYAARVVRVIDGDTFVARFAVWFGQEVETSVRLRGVDAPERAARCGGEAEGADRATRLLEDLLGAGHIALVNVSGDKYFGRVVADVVVSADDDAFPPTEIGPALLAAGVARPYGGGRRESWCDLPARMAAR